jgi:hypothetical protein
MTQRYVLIDTDDLTGLKLGPVYTVTAPTESSYLDAASADTLAASRPTNTAWAAASSVEKLAALEEATRRIDSMVLRGNKYDSDQALEFPRIIDGVVVGDEDQAAVVPDLVKRACLEEAMAIIGAGSGSLKDLQEQGVSSMSIGGKLSYTFIAGAGNSGMQSAAAKRYMRKYIGAEVR